MHIGQLKCTEAIPTNGEQTQTGEFVGRTHIKRLTLNERLGFSDCSLWFQGLDPMVDAGILNEETTGMDWSNFGTPEFTEDLMYQIAYRTTPVGDAIANGYRYFLEDFVGTSEATYYYRAIRGVRNSPKHNGGGCSNWYEPGAYLAHGLLRFATSNLCAVDIRCTGSETHLNFAVNPALGSLGDEKLQAWTDANSMKRFGNVETQRDVQNWNWESPYAGTYCKWSHSFKSFLDSALFCFMQEGSGIGTSNYTDDLTGDDHIPAKLYACITGKEFTAEDEDNFGWRMYLLERSILMRQGLTRADDELFDEVYQEYAPEHIDQSVLPDGHGPDPRALRRHARALLRGHGHGQGDRLALPQHLRAAQHHRDRRPPRERVRPRPAGVARPTPPKLGAGRGAARRAPHRPSP